MVNFFLLTFNTLQNGDRDTLPDIQQKEIQNKNIHTMTNTEPYHRLKWIVESVKNWGKCKSCLYIFRNTMSY